MTDWSQCVFYRCRFPRCNEPCINRRDSAAARDGSCRSCLRSKVDAEPASAQ
jgi:hypothetical protein